MDKLKINIGSLELKNPVMTASGTFGFGEEYMDFYDVQTLGGIIVKGTTGEKREGNPAVRMCETPMGMINAVGLQNKGVVSSIHNESVQMCFIFDYIWKQRGTRRSF